MNFKNVLATFIGLSLTNQAVAAKYDGQRWFEVEVILISQLDDKSKLKEHFPAATTLTPYRNTLDLLTPYINADISHLKQQLPFCHQENQRYQLHPQQPVAAFYPLKSLDDLALEMEQLLADKLAQEEVTLESLPSSVLSDETDDFYARVQTEIEANSQQENTELTNEDLTRADLQNNIQENNNTEQIEQNIELTGLTEKELTLLTQAEQKFDPIQFNYHDSPFYQEFCQLTQSEFDQLNLDSSRYSYNGFLIEKMPMTVSAYEDIYANEPYLLNAESLQLHNIVTGLKRSKNFRPLLHLGWRQPIDVGTVKNAIPIRLFAGNNLDYQYNIALEKFQTLLAQQNAMTNEQGLPESTLTEHELTNLSQLNKANPLSEEILKQQAKQKRIAQIISQLEQVPTDKNTLLEQINQPASPLVLTQNNSEITQPLPPIQPWYLHGTMAIYINHQNYLNIVSEFNILNHTLAEQETIKLKPDTALDLKAIRFQQHRRVISTQIHYFDHPYMGMIVQIRRYSKPERPVEEEQVTPETNQ